MIHKAIVLIFGLWMFQGILTYWQIKHYRKTLTQLKTKGRVFIGQEKGKLGAGSIVLLVADDNDTIIDIQEMKGITVFDKFKKIDTYIGKTLEDLILELSNQEKETVTTKAIKKSLKDFSIT